jgi:hypothetical protein
MTDQFCQQITGWVMQVELRDILGLLGFILAIAVQTWGIIQFMLRRIDENRDHSDREVVELHERINVVKDQYVKRTELDREFAVLQKYMTDIKDDFHRGLAGVGQRIDQVITLLSRKPNE